MDVLMAKELTSSLVNRKLSNVIIIIAALMLSFLVTVVVWFVGGVLLGFGKKISYGYVFVYTCIASLFGFFFTRIFFEIINCEFLYTFFSHCK